MYYEKEYTEDIKLTKSFIIKYYPSLLGDEDVLSSCVIKLWEKRAAFNPTIARYSTYAFQWLRQTVSDYNKKRFAKKRCFECVSIYSEFCEGIPLLDTLECKDNSQNILIEEVVSSVYNKYERLRPLIHYFLQGYKVKDIADKLCLIPTQVSYLLRKFKKLCKEEYLLSEQ